jgi:Zn-finger nucleic acid-binding protein
MPLIISPIDGSPMRQIHRYGIEIDVCPTSGGIWLDKGELERILNLIQDDVESTGQMSSPPPRPRKYDDDDDDDERHYQANGYYGSGKYYKKKGKMSRIMDLFDF